MRAGFLVLPERAGRRPHSPRADRPSTASPRSPLAAQVRRREGRGASGASRLASCARVRWPESVLVRPLSSWRSVSPRLWCAPLTLRARLRAPTPSPRGVFLLTLCGAGENLANTPSREGFWCKPSRGGLLARRLPPYTESPIQYNSDWPSYNETSFDFFRLKGPRAKATGRVLE